MESSSFIDEPNAAFLSYFYESWKEEHGKHFLEAIKKAPVNILVFDFGAGTCDISIIHVGFANGILLSRNLSISRFTALGGDNIDREIAKNILFKQIEWQINDDEFNMSEKIKNELLIPRLMPIAERLKISMVNWLVTQGVDSVYKLKNIDHSVSDIRYNLIRTRRAEAFISPRMFAREFMDVMLKFVGEEDITNTSTHINNPIYDAIEKSGISLDELYGVLFIGGSCENPMVRRCVMDMMPENVKEMIPYDLRAHVSQGAAIHCLGYHSFGFDFVRPVTSETINIVTSGEALAPLIKASTPVPSDVFEITLVVPRENQTEIEVPICLNSPERIVSVLKFYPTVYANTSNCAKKSFVKGEKVNVIGKINREKMLDIKVIMKGKNVISALVFPMSIEPMSPAREAYLKAKKHYNKECLRLGRKNISAKTFDMLIEAAKKCKYYNEVLELYVNKDSCTGIDCSTNINYYASKVGNKALEDKWGRIAVERDPCATNLFNYSLEFSGDKKINLLREALQDDDEHIPSLIALGEELIYQDNDEGEKLIKKAHKLLIQKLNLNIISEEYCRRLCHTSRILDDKDTLNKAKKVLERFAAEDMNYSQANKQYDVNNLIAKENLDIAIERD